MQWIKAGHQQLLFFTMKEYLVFAADCLPALHSELVERYNWKSFESTVQEAMNSVRQEYRDLTMVGVEQQLLAVTKSQTNLYRPSKYPFSHIVIQELEHLDDANYATSTQLNLEYLDLFYQMLIRVETNQMPFEWLVFFGATEEQCSTLIRICAQFYIDGAKTPLRKFLQEMSVKTIAAIRAMSIAYDRKVNMRMFTTAGTHDRATDPSTATSSRRAQWRSCRRYGKVHGVLAVQTVQRIRPRTCRAANR